VTRASLDGGARTGSRRASQAAAQRGPAFRAVSVVVATRDRPTELGHCLRSLIAQSHPADRIVVVDDAPGGLETPATVIACDPAGTHLRYVEGEGGGLAAAHNRGLLEVDTPIVAFTDDDVLVDQRWLEAIVEAFAIAPQVGCVTGMILPVELETPEQVWLEGYAGFNKGGERQQFDLADNRPDEPLFPFAAGLLGSGANMAFSTAALREMRGFDPALGAGTRARGGDDLAAFLEVLLRGHRLVYEPAAIVRHRHARDYSGLRRMVYGYGVGLTAYLTKCVLDHPGLLAPAVRQLPRAAAHVLSPRSAKNARRPHDYPRELARLERLGMLAGPIAYLRSRGRTRRRRVSTPRQRAGPPAVGLAEGRR
jgi:O-antigen biosynthesis protein